MLGVDNVLATGGWVGLRLLVVPLLGWAYRIRLGSTASRLPGAQVGGVQWWWEVVGLEKVMVGVALEEGGLWLVMAVEWWLGLYVGGLGNRCVGPAVGCGWE